MINEIIDDLNARVAQLESEMKNVKWIASECLKMVENTEAGMYNLLCQIDELRSFIHPCYTPAATEIGYKPVKRTTRKIKADKTAS